MATTDNHDDNVPMTVRDTIMTLLDHPLDSLVYVGKGMGPLGAVCTEVTDRMYVVLRPVTL